MSRAGDELLAVISARQRLPWQAFREAFDVLHARALHTGSGVDDTAGYVRIRSVRLLSELSHAEVLPWGGSTAICAAPTVLAALPLTGEKATILDGVLITTRSAALIPIPAVVTTATFPVVAALGTFAVI